MRATPKTETDASDFDTKIVVQIHGGGGGTAFVDVRHSIDQVGRLPPVDPWDVLVAMKMHRLRFVPDNNNNNTDDGVMEPLCRIDITSEVRGQSDGAKTTAKTTGKTTMVLDTIDAKSVTNSRLRIDLTRLSGRHISETWYADTVAACRTQRSRLQKVYAQVHRHFDDLDVDLVTAADLARLDDPKLTSLPFEFAFPAGWDCGLGYNKTTMGQDWWTDVGVYNVLAQSVLETAMANERAGKGDADQDRRDFERYRVAVFGVRNFCVLRLFALDVVLSLLDGVEK